MAIIDIPAPAGSPAGRAILRWTNASASDWSLVRFPENVAAVTIRPIGGAGYVSYTEAGAFADTLASNHQELPAAAQWLHKVQNPAGLVRVIRLYHSAGTGGGFEFEYLQEVS